VPTSWVYEQSRRGRIPTVTLGRYRRYRAEAIVDWIEALEAEGPAQSARSVAMKKLKPHGAGLRAQR
jgi:hypothetical protein